MSNLSKRVKKAKRLNFSHSPYRPSQYATWGSKDKDYGLKYYRVNLDHKREKITTPDGQKTISVFVANCQKDTTGDGRTCNCPGNERHTVCYHSLGAIYRSFEQSETRKLVSFFETYEAANRMNFGGKVAKIESANGDGVVWCVVKDWPKSQILSSQENINLMRGAEDDEGID